MNNLTNEQIVEYQNMKLFYQQYKEDSIFYKGLSNKIINNFLRSIPKAILIKCLKDLKIIKVNYVTKEVSEK